MSSAQQFHTYQEALKTTGRSIPRLIVDLDTLDENIAAIQEMVAPDLTLRLVAKSLPCIGLVDYLRNKLRTNRLMVFHQPFLSEISAHVATTSNQFTDTDILLGKPMPVDTAAFYYREAALLQNFNPFKQVQWLIDTMERLREYLELARRLKQQFHAPPLRLNLEIDVGLRRGGFNNLNQVSTALNIIAEHQNFISLSGLMGYDPHIVKIPRILRPRRQLQKSANQFYEDCKTLIRSSYPNLWREDLTFNGAGSPTLALHLHDSPLSEVAAGSAFLKPTTFDIPTLKTLKPACFIATPVLKRFASTTIPGLEFLPGKRPSCFVYGGFWKADYHFPPGIKENRLFGPSTNQSMVNYPTSTSINVGDYVFLRPHQSEFVLLQFGDIIAVRGDSIITEWPVLRN